MSTNGSTDQEEYYTSEILSDTAEPYIDNVVIPYLYEPVSHLIMLMIQKMVTWVTREDSLISTGKPAWLKILCYLLLTQGAHAISVPLCLPPENVFAVEKLHRLYQKLMRLKCQYFTVLLIILGFMAIV